MKNAVGAWAFVVLIDGREVYRDKDSVVNTTNQRMELVAALKACEFLIKEYINPFDSFNIYSDSAYLINCFRNGWYYKWLETGWINSKGMKVANQDLWNELIPYFEDFRFNFFKVKGHSGNKFNEIVDKLAREAIVERG